MSNIMWTFIGGDIYIQQCGVRARGTRVLLGSTCSPSKGISHWLVVGMTSWVTTGLHVRRVQVNMRYARGKTSSSMGHFILKILI